MEIIRFGDTRFLIDVSDDAPPGTIAKHNGNAVEITNRWNPQTRISPTFLHFKYYGLKIGESEVISGVKCQRLEDSL